MPDTVVDKLHEDFSELVKVLDKAGEISLRAVANDNFSKALLIASASYLEFLLRSSLVEYFREKSQDHNLTVEFLRSTALSSREYHKLFDWEARNANKFFRLFGDDFYHYMKQEVSENEGLNEAIRAFLEIGRERNRLVHDDFGSFALEKTADEIYELYQKAHRFLSVMLTKLRDA